MPLPRATDATRALLAAAVLVAGAGVAAAATRDDAGPCDRLHVQLAAIEAGFSDRAAQTWDQVMESQDAMIERGRVLRDLAAEGCT